MSGFGGGVNFSWFIGVKSPVSVELWYFMSSVVSVDDIGGLLVVPV